MDTEDVVAPGWEKRQSAANKSRIASNVRDPSAALLLDLPCYPSLTASVVKAFELLTTMDSFTDEKRW